MKPEPADPTRLEAAADTMAARQAEYDRIETADAHTLLAQLAPASGDELKQVQIVKRWLKKHWSDGWAAAGGPSGAPEPTPKAKAQKAGQS